MIRGVLCYVFMFGTETTSWLSKKQPIVTLSSTKDEFLVATTCACQTTCLGEFLRNCSSSNEEVLQFFVTTTQQSNSPRTCAT